LFGNKIILRTDHHSLKWLQTFKRPEGILARWVETLAKFDIEIELVVFTPMWTVFSRHYCKVAKTRWVDELDRADELTEPLGIQRMEVAPEISDNKLREWQAEDSYLGPVVEWILDGQSPPNDIVRQQSLETKIYGGKSQPFT